MYKVIKFLIINTLLSAVVFAAQTPQSGSILQEQRQEEYLPNLSKDKIAKEKKVTEVKKEKKSLTKIKIKEFIIDSKPTIFTKEYLYSLINNKLGKEFDINGLYQILDIINKEYKVSGYIIAKAFFPQQDITDGIIHIKIVEGNVDSSENGIVIKEENLRLNSEYAKKIVTTSLSQGKPLHKEQLERAILLLSDLPGIKATANLEKGSQKDTTRIIMETKEGNVTNPYVSLDNSGSRYTGVYKLTAGVDFKDPNKNGDEVKLKVTQSIGAGDLNLISLGYSIPIKYSGLKVGINTQFMKYELGEEFKSLNLKGNSKNYSIYSTYPIKRTTQTNLTFKSSYDFAILKDKQNGIESNSKNVQTLRTGLLVNRSDKFLEGGYTYGDIFFNIGDNNIKNTASFNLDQSSMGAKTNGDFKKLTFNVSRIQRGSEKFFLVGTMAGQYSYDNLDSSEKFQLGGAYGVRAYPSGEASGDNGLKSTLEARYIIASGTDIGDIRAIGFYDWGRIQQYKNRGDIVLSAPSSYNLKGWGIGMNFGKPNDFDGAITYARKIGTNPGADALTGNDSDGTNSKDRIWFSIRKFF